MHKGLVSTVIPVYNRPLLLREAVASVLSQSYSKFEIIIVDDGSDDPRMPESLTHCEQEGKGKVRVLRQPNRGPGAARQAGLAKSQGEFIQFLDSDDLLYPGKFEVCISELERQPAAAIVYGKTRYTTSLDRADIPWKRTGKPLQKLFPAILRGRIWDTSTPLFRRNVLDNAGGWTNLINEEDWELDCRIAALDVRLAWVDEWVSEQRDIATSRASDRGSSDPAKLRDRAKARELILQSALRADVPPSAPEFQQFIRYSFLVARQCVSAGLHKEGEHLVRILHEAAPRKLMRFYLLAGRLLGFGRATRLAEGAHRMLRRGAHPRT